MSALDAPAAPRASSTTRRVVVQASQQVADGVLCLDLVAADGAPLPRWEPGAHIDLTLGELVRQYSLCGPENAPGYRVAVLREPESRGGSAYVHDHLREGAGLEISTPRNHFALKPAARYLFVAGGIGITPILTMVHRAEREGADWRLVYGGRTRSSMAFLDELAAYGDRVVVHPQDECGLIDLPALLADPVPDTLIYCCGPAPLLDAITEQTAGWPAAALNLERFTAVEVDSSDDGAFEVEFRKSGITVSVDAETSVLDAAAAAGVRIESSCSSGVCGTCESLVLEGDPDHRDTVLTDEDREEGYFMPCISRAHSPRLVLDL